jgi:uroporphyrinogen-III synthase
VASNSDNPRRPLPLTNRHILITRTREQSSTLAAALQSYGASVTEIPTIRLAPPASYAPLDHALAHLATYDFLVLTSANAVRILVAHLPTPAPSQPFTQPFTVAIGPATAHALLASGLRVDLQPLPAIAESVVRDLCPRAAGKRILLARAEQARDLLPTALTAAGAIVDIVATYRTELALDSAPLLHAAFAHAAPPATAHIDAVAFTSSSTVTNFFALLGHDAARNALQTAAACSIGPVTSATLRLHGLEPPIESQQHDTTSLAAAIAAHFQSVQD